MVEVPLSQDAHFPTCDLQQRPPWKEHRAYGGGGGGAMLLFNFPRYIPLVKFVFLNSLV